MWLAFQPVVATGAPVAVAALGTVVRDGLRDEGSHAVLAVWHHEPGCHRRTAGGRALRLRHFARLPSSGTRCAVRSELVNSLVRMQQEMTDL